MLGLSVILKFEPYSDKIWSRLLETKLNIKMVLEWALHSGSYPQHIRNFAHHHVKLSTFTNPRKLQNMSYTRWAPTSSTSSKWSYMNVIWVITQFSWGFTGCFCWPLNQSVELFHCVALQAQLGRTKSKPSGWNLITSVPKRSQFKPLRIHGTGIFTYHLP